MMRIIIAVCCWIVASTVLASPPEGVRIKDLGHVDGWRDNALVGYGLVTGLAGSGDSSRSKATGQSIANMLSQFGINLSSDQVISRNVAAVMVTATIPPFARTGDKIDIITTSIGDARSLVGGTLILAPLKGPDGRVYVLAQGPVSVGGYKYDLNGNVVQKNHPTVGSIPSGGTIEVGVPTNVLENNRIRLVLSQPDYTTANRVARAINTQFGGQMALARDASSVEVSVGKLQQDNLVNFLMTIENLVVEPDSRARVVVNERNGTVIAGGEVRISNVSISHGDMRVSISTENQVSQPLLISHAGAGIRTVIVPNSRVEVKEERGETVLAAGNNSVADLVRMLLKVKTSTRDIISILLGIKAAGALHAELIIQ